MIIEIDIPKDSYETLRAAAEKHGFSDVGQFMLLTCETIANTRLCKDN